MLIRPIVFLLLINLIPSKFLEFKDLLLELGKVDLREEDIDSLEMNLLILFNIFSEKSGKCAKCGVQVNVYCYHIHFIVGMLVKPNPPVISNQLYCF